MTAVEVRKAEIGAARSIPTFYRLLLGGQLTRGRLVGLGVLSGISILLAVLSRGASDPEEAAVGSLVEYGISLLVPLAAVLLAVPMLGNLIEDRLLVYLWLKPVPRWHLAVAAVAAVSTVLVPVVVLPIGVAAVISGIGGLVVPAIAASAVGAVVYSALYVFAGARFSWGLWLALVYLALWENVLARISDGTARLSIRSYLLTIFEWGTDENVSGAGRANWAAIAIPIVVTVIATALTAWALNSRDVE